MLELEIKPHACRVVIWMGSMERLVFLAFFLTVTGQLRAWAAEIDVFNSTACRFLCEDGGQVPLGMRCDGRPDCADSSDESGCSAGNVSCAPDEWQCGGRGPCLPLEQYCDCYMDYSDSYDESAKDGELQMAGPKAACDKNEFQCAPGTPCFPLAFHCDGHPDCVDGQDEENCSLDLPASSVAPEPENKTFPQRTLKDPVYLAVIATVVSQPLDRFTPDTDKEINLQCYDRQITRECNCPVELLATGHCNGKEQFSFQNALLIALVAGVGVAVCECRKTKHSSSSYKLADWFIA